MFNVTVLLIAAIALVADAAATLTGTWNMGLQGGHVVPVALVLKQDGKTLTGTISMPTPHVGERKDIELTGQFEGGALKLSGAVDGAAEATSCLGTWGLGDLGTWGLATDLRLVTCD